MYVGTKLTQLCVLSARNKSLAWNGNYWVFAPNKDVHQSGEQFDAPNMLLPSAAGTVRFLLPSHAKQEHSTLFRRDLLATWSGSRRQLGPLLLRSSSVPVSCAEHIPIAGAFQPPSVPSLFGRKNSSTVTVPSSERLAAG